jgi:hypothetical protein
MTAMMARALQQAADASAGGLTGRHFLLGFVVLIGLIYLFIVVLAKYSKSVRRIAEFMGFRLSFKERPSSPPSAGSEEGPRKPAS